MVKWIALGLAASVGLYLLGPIIGPRLASAPEPAPPAYAVITRKAISNGHGIVVSLQAEDISRSQIEALARRERKTFVRVFVYRPGQSVGSEKAAGLWEHTTANGLKQLY